MDTLLFDRVIKVVVFKENGEALELIGDSEDQLAVNIKGNKFLGTQRSQFTVNIYNLSPITRGVISAEKYNNIRITIGHKNSYIDTIFEGTILDIYNSKENGNTTKTELICVEGYNFVNNLITSKTFASGTNYYDIAQYIIEHDLQRDVKSYELNEKLKQLKLEQDKSFYQNPYDILEEIADESNSFYKQDSGKIKLLQWTDNTVAIQVNEETGMINYPQLSTDGLNVKVIASALYEIGGLIEIKNEDVNIEVQNAQQLYQGGLPSIQFSSDGIYIIKEMDYNLSNRGNDFYIELKCYSRDIYNFTYGGNTDEK